MEAPTIIIDTREQLPFIFDGYSTITAGLPVGDYSVAGLETVVAVERKSLQDFVGSLTQGRDRFMRELQKLSAYRIKAVAVEAPFLALAAGNYRSKANPNSIVPSALKIMTDFGIPVLFAGTREQAERATLWILRRAWMKRVELGLVSEQTVAS